jgi:hypothetical protein
MRSLIKKVVRGPPNELVIQMINEPEIGILAAVLPFWCLPKFRRTGRDIHEVRHPEEKEVTVALPELPVDIWDRRARWPVGRQTACADSAEFSWCRLLLPHSRFFKALHKRCPPLMLPRKSISREFANVWTWMPFSCPPYSKT